MMLGWGRWGLGLRIMLAMDPLYYVAMGVAGGWRSNDVGVGIVGGQWGSNDVGTGVAEGRGSNDVDTVVTAGQTPELC